MTSKTNHRSALWVIVPFILFWALEIFVTKLAFIAGAKILPFSVQSSLSALLVLAVLVLPKQFKDCKDLIQKHRKVFIDVMIANALHFGVGSFLYCFGIAFTTATNVAFLICLSTLTTTLIAFVLLNESLPAKKVYALIVMLIGAYLLTTELKGLVPHTGDLLILGAITFWSLGNVLMRKALRDTHVSGDIVSLLKPIAGLPLVFLSIAFADFYPVEAKQLFLEPLFQFQHLGYAFASGTLAALLWIFLYRSLKVAEASYVSMLGLSTPVLVALMATAFLGERLSPIQLLGASLIVLAGLSTHRLARPETGSG